MTVSPSLVAGACLSALVLAMAAWGAASDPAAATATHGSDEDAGAYVAPSAEHLLGLDRNGRDMLARLVHSTRAFAGPGLLAAVAGVLLGAAAGSLTGWSSGAPGRRLSAIAARAAGVVLSAIDAVPRLALILLAALAFGGRMWAVAIGVAVSFTPTVAAEITSRVAAFRQEEFIDAARAHGLSATRILLLHILWLNSRTLLMKWAAYLFGTMVLVETSLSYLGTIEGSMNLGVAEPLPSWGNMLARAKDTLLTQGWPALIPIAAIVVSIFGFLLLAEGLGSLDVRGLRRRVRD
ncbi:MAG: ABC transporter permease [Deltaproteobacteria bacterium]|nr:ABC transporter permease [Deltaproteobacteria bacterium]